MGVVVARFALRTRSYALQDMFEDRIPDLWGDRRPSNAVTGARHGLLSSRP